MELKTKEAPLKPEGAPMTNPHPRQKGTLLVMGGIPGAGKSTLTARFQNAVRVCPDDIRKELYGDEAIQGDGKQVFALAFDRAEKWLKQGDNVLFDATNVTRKGRKNLLRKLRQYAKTAEIHYIQCPLYVALNHNQQRKRHVPENVITGMKERESLPVLLEGWDKVYIYPMTDTGILAPTIYINTHN